MEWLEIVKLIAEFGFITVAAAIVIKQVLQNDKHTDNRKKHNAERQDKIEDKIDNRYESLLDDMKNKQDTFYTLLIENQKRADERYDDLIKKMIECSQKPHVLSAEEDRRMTRIDEEIDLFLEKTVVACNASRVSLVKYHNGGNDMLGNSILKMTMSNERCAAGVIHIQQNCQNQLRSFSTFLIKELNDKGICFIEDVENIKNLDNSLYQYMKQIGVEAKYTIAINDTKNNSVIGYLSIDFINNEHVDIEQVKHCLNDKKLKIEALLNLK